MGGEEEAEVRREKKSFAVEGRYVVWCGAVRCGKGRSVQPK